MRLFLALVLALGCFSTSINAQNLLANGGFEAPVVGGPYNVNVFNGSAGYDVGTFGWTISPTMFNPSGNIDHIGTYWNPNSGAQCIDLNGNTIGAIMQSFNTTIGETYTFSFYYSNNGEMRTGDIAQGNAYVLDGMGSTIWTQLFTHTGSTLPSNMQYDFFTVNFVATSSTSSVVFEGLQSQVAGDSSQGLVLDDISVTGAAIPEPGTIALMSIGAIGLGAMAYMKRRNVKRRFDSKK